MMATDGPNSSLALRDAYGQLRPVESVVGALIAETDPQCVADFSRAIEAARLYDRESLERRNYWAQLAIVSSRRLGELIREGQEAGQIASKANGRPKKASHDERLTLSDLGLDHNASSRAQRLASIPDETISAYVADVIESGDELSKRGLLKYAVALEREAERARVVSVNDSQADMPADCVESLDALAGQQFGTIYADPPWRYSNQGTRAATDNHYLTLTVDELCELPIAELAADDAHLHLWTTAAFLPDSFRVMEAWGFEYRSFFVWIKPQMGLGNYYRKCTELLMFGVRGDAKRFNDRNTKDYAVYDRTKHSAKPEQIRHMIEACSTGPYLELFGRKPVSGWTVFGNQIEKRLFA